MDNVNDYIHRGAVEFPEQLAIITPNEQVTYAEFSARINSRVEELKANGLLPQHGYVYRSSQDVNFLVTYFAVHQCGSIAVPVESGLPDEAFNRIKAEVDAYDFPEGIADLLYTSGSTGKSKGVMLSDEALTTCAENFIHDNYYTHDLVYIITGPLSHIASLFKIHPTLMVGGTVYVINGMKDINAFYKVFDMPGRHIAAFLVPAHIRMLLQLSRDQLVQVADKVAFIETGTAPLTATDMRELATALPHAHLYNTLGGTEIGAVCTYDFNDGKYIAGCVGRPMFHSTITVDEEGTIFCSGPTIMSGYINNPEMTASLLSVDASGNRVFRSSDRGYFDEEGMLHLVGRNDDAINVGGFKADPVEIENTVLSKEGIDDCICIAVPNPIIGNSLKLLYVIKQGYEITSRDIAFYLKEKLEAYKVPALYEQVDHINAKPNGKKDRQSYKQ